jgi:hypothetical protein
MEATMVGGLAGLLGLILGRLWDRRSESSRWRRDQRIRCYEELFDTYYELRNRLRLLAAAEPGTDTSVAAVDRVLETGAVWQGNVAAVWLHGSEPVARAAKTLDDEVNDLFLDARVHSYTWDVWRARRISAEGALEELIATVRHESALPEFSVRLRWHPEKLREPSESRAQLVDINTTNPAEATLAGQAESLGRRRTTG